MWAVVTTLLPDATAPVVNLPFVPRFRKQVPAALPLITKGLDPPSSVSWKWFVTWLDTF